MLCRKREGREQTREAERVWQILCIARKVRRVSVSWRSPSSRNHNLRGSISLSTSIISKKDTVNHLPRAAILAAAADVLIITALLGGEKQSRARSAVYLLKSAFPASACRLRVSSTVLPITAAFSYEIYATAQVSCR